MEQARRKLRVCLICIVAVAVLVGCIYYVSEIRGRDTVSEGTLVQTEIGTEEWQQTRTKERG